MSSPTQDPFNQTLLKARQALEEGDRRAGRRLAELAAAMNPDSEEPWLLLAALGSPKASLAYLKRALEIKPDSQRARRGMHWAIQRQRAEPEQPGTNLGATQPVKATAVSSQAQVAPAKRRVFLPSPIRSESLVRPRQSIVPWAMMLLALAIGFLAWFNVPRVKSALANPEPFSLAQVNILKASPTFTPTFTATATNTLTPTFTPTNTPTPTSTPTETPTSTPTFTPSATATQPPLPPPPPTQPPPPKPVYGPGYRPNSVGLNDRWIAVDLSSQTTYAMQGDQVANQFICSTGTWQTPTVTGVFRIYVKYRKASMSGPGYYLPNVPYVMYFYKGYGVHGTYWHNNFGTPMSHGCVNLRTTDAAWLFDFAGVGTVVSVRH